MRIMRSSTGKLWQLAAGLLPLIAVACGDAEATDGSGGTAGAGAGDSGGASSGGTGVGGGSGSTMRIAFGSCMHQDLPKPVLDIAAASAPDHFVFLGDNIYGDTQDMAVLQQKYDLLAASPEFQNVLAVAPAIATWDDHDYGQNDAGNEYPFKAESKEIFLDFWKEPRDSPRRTRDGIYTSYRFEEAGRTLQIIVLDTRYFRDALDANTDPTMFKNDYMPTTDTSRTILGEAQWAWLEGQLLEPADVRIIASSIQFGHQYNGWESWTNMPHERQRMVDLIKTTGAEATVFISGDVHWAELSKLEVDGGYPLYDLTSSGITEDWPSIESNENRVGDPVAEHNYGFVEVAWGDSGHLLTFGIVDVDDKERIRHEVSTSDLVF
jgi:alkaline phosphatase D